MDRHSINLIHRYETVEEMIFHRSRVNYVNKVTPINISREINLECRGEVEVFTPLNDEKSLIKKIENEYTITLPENTAYAIIKITKR